MTTEKKTFDKIFPNNELEKRIMDAFEVFDHSAKQVVDVREIGTILRSLGCCPTEAEVQEVILATENKEATGNVPLAYFLPYLSKAMVEHRFYPASAEVLLAAFRYFDEEGRGYVTKERFTQLMLEEGEPFTQESTQLALRALKLRSHGSFEDGPCFPMDRKGNTRPRQDDSHNLSSWPAKNQVVGPKLSALTIAIIFNSFHSKFLSYYPLLYVYQEEFDEMMQTALDPVTDTITYEYYINQLMVEDEVVENQEPPI